MEGGILKGEALSEKRYLTENREKSFPRKKKSPGPPSGRVLWGFLGGGVLSPTLPRARNKSANSEAGKKELSGKGGGLRETNTSKKHV